MSKNYKQTSDKIVSIAAKKLNDKNASVISKRLAGSILAQANKER